MGKTLVIGVTININLKSSTDVISPLIVLAAISGIDYLSFNYAHIPELGRYYFISDISSINGKLWGLTLMCDVLETYSSGVKVCSAKYRRGVKTGDYHITGVDHEINESVFKYLSDVTISDTDHTNVLTVVEGGVLI